MTVLRDLSSVRRLEQLRLERRMLEMEKFAAANGFDVSEFARQKDPGMPAVLLTGYATQDANLRAEESEIPVLFEPIDIDELLQTISEMLRDDYEQRKATG